MKVDTGVDWSWVRERLDKQDYEENDGQFERFVFLGTVFALFPSGKYYMPWACSNLAPCAACKGTGHTRGKPHKRRVWVKWANSRQRLSDWANKHGVRGLAFLQSKKAKRNKYLKTRNYGYRPSCEYCGGCGSREAHLDDCYREALVTEAEEHGLFISSGESDPCDVLVGEVR